MKKTTALLFALLCISFSPLYAIEEVAFFDLSSSAGTYTTSTTDPDLAFMNGNFDFDLTGGGFSTGYYRILDTNMLFGGGYQSYSLQGESGTKALTSTISGTTVNWNIAYKITELSYSGLFGMFGYHMGFAEKWSFDPHARLAISNKVTVKDSVYVKFEAPSLFLKSESETPGSESQSLSFVTLHLPIGYKFDNFSITYQLQIGGPGYKTSTATSSSTAQFGSNSQLIVGYYF